jgi:hypothetical protein
MKDKKTIKVRVVNPPTKEQAKKKIREISRIINEMYNTQSKEK